jgi:hypothetical protein
MEHHKIILDISERMIEVNSPTIGTSTLIYIPRVVKSQLTYCC